MCNTLIENNVLIFVNSQDRFNVYMFSKINYYKVAGMRGLFITTSYLPRADSNSTCGHESKKNKINKQTNKQKQLKNHHELLTSPFPEFEFTIWHLYKTILQVLLIRCG